MRAAFSPRRAGTMRRVTDPGAEFGMHQPHPAAQYEQRQTQQCGLSGCVTTKGAGMGCVTLGGLGEACIEPANPTSNVHWNYVGSGRGGYEKLSTARALGQGEASPQQKSSVESKFCMGFTMMLVLMTTAYFGVTKLGGPVVTKTMASSDVPATAPPQRDPMLLISSEAANAQSSVVQAEAEPVAIVWTTLAPVQLQEFTYDCVEQDSSWDDARRSWCCAKFGVGCQESTSGPPLPPPALGTVPPAVAQALPAVSAGASAATKQATTLIYDCQVGLDTWKQTWSLAKMAWCCYQDGVGCPPSQDDDEEEEEPTTPPAVNVPSAPFLPGTSPATTVASTSTVTQTPTATTTATATVTKTDTPTVTATTTGTRTTITVTTTTGVPTTTTEDLLLMAPADLTTPRPKEKFVKLSAPRLPTQTATTTTPATTQAQQKKPREVFLPAATSEGSAVDFLPPKVMTLDSSSKNRGDSSSGEAVFDCKIGVQRWEKGWSVLKRAWCCKHEEVACGTFDCIEDLHHWRQLWTPAKKEWCCKNEKRGCMQAAAVTAQDPFACDIGLSNWQTEWSAAKKMWCCDRKQMGCPDDLMKSYDCGKGLNTWNTGWSENKKSWCCENKGFGCPQVMRKRK